MNSIAELFNDNSISTVAAAFFTALFAAIGAVFVQNLQARREAKEGKNAALEAKDQAEQARINTESVANGFAGKMDRKLTEILAEQREMGKALRKHLEWHLEKDE